MSFRETKCGEEKGVNLGIVYFSVEQTVLPRKKKQKEQKKTTI
jgi:hypothetical protein